MSKRKFCGYDKDFSTSKKGRLTLYSVSFVTRGGRIRNGLVKTKLLLALSLIAGVGGC